MTLASQAVLAQVQVPRASSTHDITALETAMLSLTLDAHQPVALDIAGTPTSRAFLLRAATPVALRHLAAQIQARYPQAEITEAPVDPLALAPGEVASVVELRPATETYLPLRTLAERELLKEGADPLLGVLAAFSHLPPQSRAVIHLALLPLPATWSRAFRRRAVEHPLEPERRRWQQERTRSEQAPSPIRLVALALLVALLLVGWWVQPIIRAVLPAWMLAAARAVLHGSTPLLTASETMQLLGAGIGTLVFSAALALGGRVLLSRLWRTPIYDMRLVDEKTGRLAYRACLRLVVITPSAYPLPAPVWSWLWRGLRTGGRRSPRQWGTLALAAWQERRRLVYLRRAEILAPQRETLALLAAAFRPYQTASGASLQAHLLSPRLTRRFWRPRRRQPGWVRGVAHARQVLSVADLATLWHLPQAQDVAEVPYLVRGRARTLPAPAALSTGQGYRLGTATHAGQTSPVFLPAECLRHNLLAVASTGKGKSTLFTHLARAAMQEPARGLVVVEPHGDLVATLCGLVPASRREDVVVVDLADRAFPVGLNPLDMTLGRDRDKAVDTLIQIASSLWADSYGPRTENVLEYAAKTLAEANTTLVRADPIGGPARQYTLLDIVPLLRRTSFRHAVLEQVADPVLTDWWATYYEPLDVRMQSEVTSSVITKLSKFASSRVARRMLGQADTCFR
ncbi:MAG TPA: hypothetical protein VHD63_28785 [Ktedonobacteraceae bacterium]|nr:hypothetical protein [Ktedonobacteraceae bacterium]